MKEGSSVGASLCEGFHEGDLGGWAPLLGNPKDEVFEIYAECHVNGPPSPYGPCWGHYDSHGLNNTLYFLVYTFLTP